MSAATLAMPRNLRVLLADLDVDAIEVARRAGLPDRALETEPRLTIQQYHSLWVALEGVLGADAPVVLAETISGDNFDPELFAALCCPHLEAATDVVARWNEASMLLGYRHPRSFRRAVRTWRREAHDIIERSHP